MELRKKPFNKSNAVYKITLIVIAAITVYSLWTIDNKGVLFWEAAGRLLQDFVMMFGQAHFKNFTFTDAVHSVFITLGLAMITTLIGSLIGIVTGLLAARNISGGIISQIVKTAAAIIRSVPTTLWVLIFAVTSGLGSTAAIVGMTFHTVSYLTKAFSESFEEMDPGILEALKGSGANKLQIIFQAVIPSSLSYMLSWTFLRLEINFSNAIAMGAAAGAGGIGYEMFMSSGFYFDLREMGTLTYFILFIAIFLEWCSTHLKKKIKSGDLAMNAVR